MNSITAKKGQTLQRKGDLNTKVYLVESGLLRSYTIDEKGREHIFMFAPKGWIVADNLSADEPADLFIDVLEETVLVVKEKHIESEPHLQKMVNRLGAYFKSE
ncbi:cyclic nucleotide-binding domain-containing protein [bacterium]|nr:cyclic nucleotide-binding domain-containing protein [bacterium]